jgi:hypothetical protein
MAASKAPRVALVSGFWGQNIGNAFFNLGGKWILEQIFGEGEVEFIQDQPGGRTFHDAARGNPENDVGLLQHLDIDYVVMQGPLFTETFAQLWGPTLAALTSRGTKVILMSAAFFKFRDREIANSINFLKQFPPILISTRDTRSFDILKSFGLGIPLYDGVDSAFFVPKVYSPFKVTGVDYYAFNFDRYPEPTIVLGEDHGSAPEISFEADSARWNLHTPTLVAKLAHRSKVQAYLGHALDRRTLPSKLNGRMIIRPEHRFNPHLPFKIYQHPNAVASDEPWTYFTVYANARLTLADRVHACVITLAYGNPAMLFTPSPRATLFDRLGLEDIRKRPVALDLEQLEYELQKELAWLKAQI